MDSIDFYILVFFPLATVAFLGALFLKTALRPTSYINSNGYVVLTQFNDLEHRFIAKQRLGRDLKKNEIVHHINGQKTDNKITNLCLMDREKHEHFHAWLSWKKRKSGKYPSFYSQKRVLEKQYDGTLLEKITPPTSQSKFHNLEKHPVSKQKETNHHERLYNKLKQERKKLAVENGIPVYMIFHNKTLMDISQQMPTCESSMRQISGVGPEKMRLYGNHFIEIICNFKNNLNEDSRDNRNSG